MTTVTEALQQRVSTRAFLDKPVARDTLDKIFLAAQQAPSNCNVQPWQTIVVSGEQKEALRKALIDDVIQKQQPYPDFNWAVAYQGVHRERQIGSAMALYNAMGIERDNKEARMKAMLRNWEFFDAPHVAIFTMDKYLDIMGAVDLGIYAQSLALVMCEHGISSCMQGALGQFPEPIHQMFELPEERGVLFGMSFGYADAEAAPNQARTTREELGDSVLFAG